MEQKKKKRLRTGPRESHLSIMSVEKEKPTM
jgi:hypothetical protein